MDTKSILQQQFPLSPRKFWKKMYGEIIGGLVFSIVIGLIPVFISFVFSVNDNPNLTGNQVFMKELFVFIIWMLGIFIVRTSLYMWYWKTYIARYYYDATDSYITIKKGVLMPAEIHIQYSKIQDVYVDQDIFDRIMGLYDVHLASATAASGIEAHIDGVDKAAADGLKNFLLQKLHSGGSISSPSQNPTSNTIPSTPSQPITFEKEISSNTYPITSAWFVQQAINWFFTSVFYSAIIDLFLVSPGKNGAPSITEMFGLGSTTLWSVFIGLFIVIYSFHLIYMALWRSTYFFSFLPDYIVTKQGIIAKAENHLPYRSVQDVSVSQGIIERMLGLATVRIENAAAMQMVGKNMISSAIKIPGQPLAQANEISDAVKRVALTKNSSQTGL